MQSVRPIGSLGSALLETVEAPFCLTQPSTLQTFDEWTCDGLKFAKQLTNVFLWLLFFFAICAGHQLHQHQQQNHKMAALNLRDQQRGFDGAGPADAGAAAGVASSSSSSAAAAAPRNVDLQRTGSLYAERDRGYLSDMSSRYDGKKKKQFLTSKIRWKKALDLPRSRTGGGVESITPPGLTIHTSISTVRVDLSTINI